MSFWESFWLIVTIFAFVAYLMVMFNIVTDLFRDKETSGLLKAVWIVALIFLPFLTALVYLITRGGGMAQRQLQAVQRVQAAQEDYIQSVAGTNSPADQIARAKELLDSGAISREEFDHIKSKALS
jgi:predicted PurR-regulated permease PerM